MTPIQDYYATLADSMIKKMEKRGFEAYYCPDRASAVEKALSLMPEGSSITWGGSMTLVETGLLSALDPNRYQLIDRNQYPTPEAKKECYQKAYGADYFLMSSNAITTDGELVNIDGAGNRVSMLIHGPEHVLMLVGMNKTEPTLSAAIDRVHAKAAPPNAKRLGLQTPCALTGVCSNCLSPDCICAQTVITRYSRIKNRIKVILIGESLGY